MEKTYIMTIRDLSNEARELNAQAIKIKAFEEEVEKKVQVMAESHVSAIASYLNHQLDEIARFTTRFSAGICENDERIIIKIEKRNENIVYLISIKPRYYLNFMDFVINSSNSKYFEIPLTGISKKAFAYAEALIRNWTKLKKELSHKIKVEIDYIQKNNEEKQHQLQEKLALYENFEL